MILYLNSTVNKYTIHYYDGAAVNGKRNHAVFLKNDKQKSAVFGEKVENLFFCRFPKK